MDKKAAQKPIKSATNTAITNPVKANIVRTPLRPGERTSSEDCSVPYSQARSLSNEDVGAAIAQCQQLGDEVSIVNLYYVQCSKIQDILEDEVNKKQADAITEDWKQTFSLLLHLFIKARDLARKLHHQLESAIEIDIGILLLKYTQNNNDEAIEHMENGLNILLESEYTITPVSKDPNGILYPLIHLLVSRGYDPRANGEKYYKRRMDFLHNYLTKYSAFKLDARNPADIHPEKEETGIERYSTLAGLDTRCVEDKFETRLHMLILDSMFYIKKDEQVLEYIEEMKKSGATAPEVMSAERYMFYQELKGKTLERLQRFEEAKSSFEMIKEHQLYQADRMLDILTGDRIKEIPDSPDKDKVMKDLVSVYENRTLAALVIDCSTVADYYYKSGQPAEARRVIRAVKRKAVQGHEKLSKLYGSLLHPSAVEKVTQEMDKIAQRHSDSESHSIQEEEEHENHPSTTTDSHLVEEQKQESQPVTTTDSHVVVEEEKVKEQQESQAPTTTDSHVVEEAKQEEEDQENQPTTNAV